MRWYQLHILEDAGFARLVAFSRKKRVFLRIFVQMVPESSIFVKNRIYIRSGVKYSERVFEMIMTGLEFYIARLRVITASKGHAGLIRCPTCGTNISLERMFFYIYPHSSGWHVCTPIVSKQWISIECPGCNYQLSFDKLNIPRRSPHE